MEGLEIFINRRMKKFIAAVTKALKNYNQSINKAYLAYKNLELYIKNTLEKLNKVLINLTS